MNPTSLCFTQEVPRAIEQELYNDSDNMQNISLDETSSPSFCLRTSEANIRGIFRKLAGLEIMSLNIRT